MVEGDAVFEAMGAAGIHADIAGDGAGELRGRVGGVEEAVFGHRRRDREVGDARLDADRAVGNVDGEDARHLRHADDDRVLLRDGAARERGAGAARHHLDAERPTGAQHGRHLLSRARQRHGERHPAIGGERVGLVGAPLVFPRHQTVMRQQRGERGDDLVAAREDRGVGRGEGDLRHGRPADMGGPLTWEAR